MNARHHPAIAYNAIKTAVKRLLNDVGGIDAAAACTRGTRSLFSEYGSITSDRQVPVDVVLDLESIAGIPHVTSALAAVHGYELVRIAAPRGSEQVATALGRVGQGMAVLFADTARALADGAVTPVTNAALTRDLEDVSRLVSDALSLLRFQTRGEKQDV